MEDRLEFLRRRKADRVRIEGVLTLHPRRGDCGEGDCHAAIEKTGKGDWEREDTEHLFKIGAGPPSCNEGDKGKKIIHRSGLAGNLPGNLLDPGPVDLENGGDFFGGENAL